MGRVILEKMRFARTIVGRNFVFFVLTVLYCSFFYFLTNHFPSRSPALLTAFPFESAIRLMPWTSWIYLSYFLMILYVGVRLLRHEWFIKGVSAIACVITVSGIIFLVYPTTIVRPPISDGDPSAWVLALVRIVDPPNNCFPSLHVGLIFSCTLLMLMARRAEGVVMLIWSILISISTLTTKQHYAIDLIGGLCLAVFFFFLFFGRNLVREKFR